jgi:predicted PurR-regulated permease PerM
MTQTQTQSKQKGVRLQGYIPSIGSWFALIPLVFLALMEFGMKKALIVLGGYLLIYGSL